MTLKRDLELLYEIGCLRHLQRTWRHFLNADFENVAEHTLRVVWIALVLAKHEEQLSGASVDYAKMMRMALVHDLTESRTGDTNYVTRLFTKRDEAGALHAILKDTVVEEFEALWHEYEERHCVEAQLVKDADTLDCQLEIQEQSAKGVTLKDSWASWKKHIFKQLYTESAKKFWIAIGDSNPHDWHLNAGNRFTAGDWKADDVKKLNEF